jgi:hypothetical protein
VDARAGAITLDHGPVPEAGWPATGRNPPKVRRQALDQHCLAADPSAGPPRSNLT